MTTRIICKPAVSGVGAELIVCQICQPPVSGTVIGPVTSMPSISTWNTPPGPTDATRAFTV